MATSTTAQELETVYLFEYIPENRKPYRISPLSFPDSTQGTGVVLQPGVNTLNGRQLKAIEDVPAYKKMWESLKADRVIIDRTPAGGVSEAEPALAKLTVDESIDIIEKTYDVETLERWRHEDDRRGVHKAIDRQLAKIKEPEPEQKGGFKSAPNTRKALLS